MEIKLSLCDFISMEIEPQVTAKLIKYCKGGIAKDEILKEIGRMAINNRDLDSNGASKEYAETLKYAGRLINEI